MEGATGAGRTTRLLALGTAIVLAFDAAALGILGALLDRTLLIVLAAGCAVAAALVLLGLRWQVRRMDEMRRAQRDLRDELRSIDDFVHRR